jgi:hypothetical protein
MKLPASAHTSRPWRIHEIAPDFPVEDVWALPATGTVDDFPAVVDLWATLDFPDSASLPVRFVWGVRDLLGRLGLGRISQAAGSDIDRHGIPGTDETTLLARLPEDLRGTVDPSMEPSDSPMRPLYMTENEYTAEMSNRTMHSVMHLGWVDQADGRYQAQMAVLVKARGLAGRAYMASIKPIRHALVYPALMRAIEVWTSKRCTWKRPCCACRSICEG